MHEWFAQFGLDLIRPKRPQIVIKLSGKLALDREPSPKAVLKPPHSKRFAPHKPLCASRSVWSARVFSAALGFTPPYPTASMHEWFAQFGLDLTRPKRPKIVKISVWIQEPRPDQ